MKTANFFVITAALFAASGFVFASDADNSSTPLNVRGEQKHLAPATHQPAAAIGNAGSVVGKNESRKPAQQSTSLSRPVTKPTLPVDAGQQHGVAIIGGAAMKTSRETGVINGTERRRSR